MNKFFTATGDQGFSCGIRKDSEVFDLLGNLDELQSFLGMSKVLSSEEFYLLFEYLQQSIFKIQAQIYNYKESNKLYIRKEDLQIIEENVILYSKKIQMIDCFTLTGSNQFSATVDYARTLARRAERSYIRYSSTHMGPLKDELIKKFLNRLSSLLFVISKYYDTDKTKVDYNATYERLQEK